jgi:hypothetical protein
VVTAVPTEAAWALNAWSFWRWTWACQSAAVKPASATKTPSSSQAIHVRAPVVPPAIRRDRRTVPLVGGGDPRLIV